MVRFLLARGECLTVTLLRGEGDLLKKIFSGYDFTGGRIFHFPIDF